MRGGYLDRTPPAALYADGGVIQSNPSSIGGTWAWCGVDLAGERFAVSSGVVLATPQEPEITNNQMEFVAAVRALDSLPDGWIGILASDSQVTIGRLFWGWAMNNLPELWLKRWLQVKGRLGKVTPLLLKGHPSASELRTGRAANGSPVSVHQVFVDEECQRLAGEYVNRTVVAVAEPATGFGIAPERSIMSKQSLCKTCGAPITWRKQAEYPGGQVKSDAKANPIDAQPTERGNILLSKDGERYMILPTEVQPRYVGRLHVSHFATCPSAKEHKRR